MKCGDCDMCYHLPCGFGICELKECKVGYNEEHNCYGEESDEESVCKRGSVNE